MKEGTPAPVPVQGPVSAVPPLDAAAGLKTSHSHLAGLATQTQKTRAALLGGGDVDTTPTASISKAAAEGITTTSTKWNTKNLGLRLGADLVSAASAAVLVAPVISIIDRSIMENASGAAPLLTSLRRSLRSLLLSPRSTILSKPFGLIFLLYGGTYLTANTLDTTVTTVKNNPNPAHVTSGSSKFFASSAANIGLCIYKDQVFVRLFGPPGAVPRPVGLPSYLLFAARDCMTIFASFNVPPLLGPVLTERLSKDTQKYVTGQTMAQFAAPAVVQLFSTPVHLLGLDMYNRPSAGGGGGQGSSPSWGERFALVRKNWAVSVAARICRIVPAFGVGGVVNMKVRKGLMERLS
ncbi:hypothetical protein B0H65DRAFT_433039 [Neurospora tetraspora]|uniref:Sequence orphan n=1 Tax=Neurospora tetraspora TaxID=94610 RepID=A0AAE0J8V9_9PEZI|nr:hypothetical protein B0H65DRAFT_433039 [Neurospora tetraspora]